MDFRQAHESADLAQDIRAALRQSDDGPNDPPKVPQGMIERVDAIIQSAPADTPLGEWELMAAGLRVFANLETCRKIALSREGNLLEERARGEILLEEFRRKLSPDLYWLPKILAPTRRKLIGGSYDPTDIRGLLASIPLPTVYWSADPQKLSFGKPETEAVSRQDPIVKVIAFLDQQPVASPQFLNQAILYGLTFQLRGLEWPEKADRLRLNLNTTCPDEVYSVSEFSMDTPTAIHGEEFEASLTGRIIFNAKQSSLVDDLVFTVHAAFETNEGGLTEVPVIGHNELRFKVVESPIWLPSAGHGPLDQHIVNLVEELIKECPSVQQELDDLFPMLDTLGRVCATYAQEAAYKGRTDVSEKEFQKDVLRDLRIRLGASDVQEHPKQAGGIPDIRFRRVIVELKVEDENGDREHLAHKYARQATQYAGVEARQVSVLLILDLTEKANPPGSIRNDIFLADVPTHGTGDTAAQFPSKAVVFVVNGNTRNPSSYSR